VKKQNHRRATLTTASAQNHPWRNFVSICTEPQRDGRQKVENNNIIVAN